MAEAAFPALQRVLVVEDDRPLCGALARIARSSGAEVCEAHTLAEGRAMLSKRPQLMIVDLWLEGESAMGVLEEAARHRPAPAILAISGRASNDETFLMGKLGAAEFLQKPLFHEQVVQKANDALAHAPDLERSSPPTSARTGSRTCRTACATSCSTKRSRSRRGAAAGPRACER